jgi:hypothetical protein
MQPLIVAMVVACIVLWIPIPKKSEDVEGESGAEKHVANVQGETVGPGTTALPVNA